MGAGVGVARRDASDRRRLAGPCPARERGKGRPGSSAAARLARLGLSLPDALPAQTVLEARLRLLDQNALVLGLQLVHSQWQEVAPSIAKFDGLRFVVAHMALPLDLSRAGRAEWIADLRQMSRYPGAYLSLAPAALQHARPATFSSRQAQGFAALDSFVYQAIDTFGPERCLFATAAMPAAVPYESIEAVMAGFYRWLARYSAGEQEQLFAANARALFGLRATSSSA